MVAKRKAHASQRATGSTRKTKSRSAKRASAKKSPKRASRRVLKTVSPSTDAVEPVEEARALPKTRLGEKTLRQFAELLLAKRRELVGDVEHLTFRALSGNNSSSGGTHMPLHMAELGSDNWEQEFALELLENERALVHEIDEALQRIQDRTYGICLATRRPIGRTRLVAKPWAKYCIEYARLREQGRTS